MLEDDLLNGKTEILNSIVSFKNDVDVQKLQSLYFSKSYSEILSVSRWERSHSSFIAWLLDDKESHGLAKFGIQKFLKIIFDRGGDPIIQRYPVLVQLYKNKIYDEKGRDLIIQRNPVLVADQDKLNDLIFSVKKVEREKHIERAGRLDIYAEVILKLKDSDYTLKLIIENKVDSTETENEKGISQTQKYYDHFEKPKPTRKNSKKYIKNNEINLYVYLTAIPSIVLNQLREPLSGCKDFIQINYQDLLDNLFEPILDMDNILERTRFMVGEYIQSLSHHAIKGEVKDEKRKSTVKQALIMALGKEERELLSSFWREHEKLILTALYALSTHGSKDEKISDTRHKLQAVSSPNSKDRSKYSLKYEGELFKKDFLKCDIGLNTVKLLISKGLIDNDVFNFLREDRTCKLQLIKDKEEITPNERQKNKYKSIETPEFYFNGKKYFVASNWAAETANIFIEKIEKKFKNITFLK